MLPALAATILSITTAAFASQPRWAGKPILYILLLLSQLPLGLWALFSLHRSGRMRERLRPQWGDITLAMVSSIALLIATWAGRALISPPMSPKQAWLARLYLHLGDPTVLEQTLFVPFAVIAVALLDELVWRGWVQDCLTQRLGTWRAVLVTGVLYALQAIPTLFNLADPVVGLNPLLLPTALAAGLLWSYLTGLRRSAIASMVSHAAFTYFTVMQFRPGW